MGETLQELDISNTSVEKKVTEFFQLTSCRGLKSLSIPPSIVAIEYVYISEDYERGAYGPVSCSMKRYSFTDCTSLAIINVHPDNPVYGSENGKLYKK